MQNLLKVLLFSLLTIGFFDGFTNFGVPRIEPGAPPEEEKLDLSAMTMDGFIALGDRIFNGKGTCTLCHNAVGGRAPLLDRVATRVAERLADPRYQGSAGDAESYIYESMIEPSAYVVAGFGKSGTQDTESPMPVISGSSVGLSEVEIRAVISYLQNLGGTEVTVEIPADAGKEQEIKAAAASGPREPLATVEEIVTKFGCGACHTVAGQAGQVGPNLMSIGASRNKDYLRRSILTPNADIAEGFIPNLMPRTFGAQLYASELEVLVDYLAGLQGSENE